MTRRDEKIRKVAAEIHRCPEGYDGPCWGPTEADIAEAKAILATTLEGQQ